MKRTCLQVLVVRLLLVARREVLGASLPVFPSLLPPSTTLVGPAEEPTPQLEGTATVFTQQNNTEHRSQVGTTAVLHCIAHNVGENTVSWVRKRDYHLLTVGSQTYSSDNRFQVRYIKQENDWQLHIRYVQVRDDGVYECQVSSHPPVSLLSTLHVLEATSEILGGPEKYMTVGSSLRLVCVLRDNTQPPSYVFWYHDHHMINYHATREVRVENNGGLSVLFLSNVRPADSGNYTCAPSNAQPAHISIHVLQGGETPAAIHSGASERSTSSLPLPLVLSLLLCLASTYLSRASSTTVSFPEPPAPRAPAAGTHLLGAVTMSSPPRLSTLRGVVAWGHLLACVRLARPSTTHAHSVVGRQNRSAAHTSTICGHTSKNIMCHLNPKQLLLLTIGLLHKERIQSPVPTRKKICGHTSKNIMCHLNPKQLLLPTIGLLHKERTQSPVPAGKKDRTDVKGWTQRHPRPRYCADNPATVHSSQDQPTNTHSSRKHLSQATTTLSEGMTTLNWSTNYQMA